MSNIRRSILARKDGKSSDIPRFFDEAVQARLFDLTVTSEKKRNRSHSQKEILAAIENALEAT